MPLQALPCRSSGQGTGVGPKAVPLGRIARTRKTAQGSKACADMYVCIHGAFHIHIYIYIYAHIQVYLYIYNYICIYIYLAMCTDIYMYMCVYIYIYTYQCVSRSLVMPFSLSLCLSVSFLPLSLSLCLNPSGMRKAQRCLFPLRSREVEPCEITKAPADHTIKHVQRQSLR